MLSGPFIQLIHYYSIMYLIVLLYCSLSLQCVLLNCKFSEIRVVVYTGFTIVLVKKNYQKLVNRKNYKAGNMYFLFFLFL